MAYPVIASWQDSDSAGSAVTSLTCTAPSGITAGDLLIILVGSDDSGDGPEFTINTGTYPGWIGFVESGSSSVDAHLGLFAKIATGSEGNVVVNAASSDEMQGMYYRITGHGADPVGSSLVVRRTDDTGSPWSSAGFSVGSLDADTEYLLISGMSMDGGDGGTITVSSTVGNWTKTTQINSGTSGNDNMGCYAQGYVTGITAGAAVTYTTGNKSDGATLYDIAIPEGASGVTASVTGVEATGSPGSVTVSAVENIDVSVTGVAATASPGSVTVAITVSVDVPLTGVSATGSPGAVTINGDANTLVTGVTATGQVGSVTPVGDANVPVSGVSATASPGAVTVAIATSVNVPLTGVEATGVIASFSVDTYYFDASVAGPFCDDEPQGEGYGFAWLNIDGGFDGSTASYAISSWNGDVDTNEVRATGTTAPASGETVSQVRMRLYSGAVTASNNRVVVAVRDGGTSLGQQENYADLSDAWSDYVTLDTPSGGWTWGKLQNLEAVAWGETDSNPYYKELHKVEIEVTSGGSLIVTGDANVYPTGVVATGSVGAVTVVADSSIPVDVPVSGVSATGSPGAVTVATSVDVAVSGSEATGSPGTLTVTGDANVLVSGIAATGQVGSVTLTGDANVLVTGLSSTGLVGTVTAWIGTSVSLTGLAATGSPGSITITGDANVALTGVAATASAGTVTVSTEAGETVLVTGVTATGYVGALTVSVDQSVSLSGLAATAQVGSVSVTGDANTLITGVAATGQVGTVLTAGDVNVPLIGVAATGQVGSLNVTLGIDVPVTGVSATGNVGSVTTTGDANVLVTGVEATASPGQVIVATEGSVTAPISGVAAVASPGSVTVDAISSVVVPINGVSATANPGSVTVSTGEVPETPDIVGGAFDDEFAQEKILSLAEHDDQVILAVIKEYLKAA